jgi:hypothetical protein
MKFLRLILVMWMVFFGMCVVLAQTNGIDTGTTPLPSSKTEFWQWAIAGITPVIIWLVSKIPADLPKPLLPILTPIVGLLLGSGLKWLGAADLGWVDMVQAGALAVFVREVVNQTITKRLQPPAPPDK